MTLTEFLLARIAEDEARVDTIPDWYCTDSARGEGWGSRGDCPLCDRYMFDGTEAATKDAMWEHMEDVHRRTRVLADCKAKRRIMGLHERQPTGHCSTCTPADYGWFDHEPDFAQWPCDTMKALALPYAAHPDHREEWRP
jgi:hypothetical protein